MPSILITGGAGFFGTAFCQRLRDMPEWNRVAILSRDWHKHVVLREKLNDDQKFRWFIGDIRDKDRLVRAFRDIDVIVHAGATKDVVSSQYSPREALLTNCIGTQNVIDAAIDCGVKKVFLISSDKAVNGLNLYGQTKAVSESLVVAANSYSPGRTIFSAGRWGNVFGSSSSVVPLFLRQRESGTLTLTHPKMSRFWVSIEQVVDFVLRCLEEMQGGEIFIPKLNAAPVTDLARAIAPDAKIEIVGMRPGEKLSELMLSSSESTRTKDVGWAYRIEPSFKFWDANIEYLGGSPVPDGWEYTSASANRLTVEEIRSMLPSANLRK